ncbi:MAG: universal stress protein [Actinomycetota bacterium]
MTTDTALPNRWIVGVDGSCHSRRAVDWALANAAGRTSQIQLTTAWSVPAALAYPPAPAISNSFPADLERAAVEMLGEVERQATIPGDLDVTKMAVCGGPANVLLDAAEDASLLVVGSRGHGGFTRLLLGSTSTQVATHAHVPVVVVPESGHSEALDRVVVGIDGSANSLAALDWTLGWVSPGTSVEALMVWDLSPLMPGNERFVYPEETGLGEERLEHLVGAAVDRVGRRDISVHHRFRSGSARAEIQHAAERADLVITGARGHGAIGAAILGSVSTWLLHHLDVPMVVVPHAVSSEES